MEQSFVLKGNICYSETQKTLATLPNSYVVCVEGTCAGAFAHLPEQYANLPLHDCGAALIVPGLVDLHVHAPQYTFRALGMDLELLDWLNTYTFPEEARYSSLAYAEAAYTKFVEDLVKGPNTRAGIFATTHLPATRLLMNKLEASGLCTLVGKVNMDRNASEALCEAGAAASAADTRRWLAETVGQYKNTHPILTPRFIPSCSDELLCQLHEIQQEHHLPVQSHLSENPGEIAWVQELCPDAQFYGDAYDRFGLFGRGTPTIMAHCVWSGEAEIARMRQNGVFVAHCPQSNTNLASGIAPARRYLDEGIPMGLGSDVAGGCHTSIFRAMADAIQVSKLRWRLVENSGPPLTLQEAFYLGTKGGGAFFGRVGSFEAGYEFDALVLDDASLQGPRPLELQDRLARVIYCADERHIAQKYVRGISIL